MKRKKKYYTGIILSSTKWYNFTCIRKLPRPKLFSRFPHLPIPNIRSISHEKPRISRQKATIAARVRLWKNRIGVHLEGTSRNRNDIYNFLAPPVIQAEPASLILESVSNPRRTTILAFSPRYSILIFPTSWCGCHKRSLCRPQNVQQHVSERSSNLSSSGYLLKQLTMKEEGRRNKGLEWARDRYMYIPSAYLTDTNLRWTLNELFDVPLYLENRIRAERRLLITVLGQASINWKLIGTGRIVHLYVCNA